MQSGPLAHITPIQTHSEATATMKMNGVGNVKIGRPEKTVLMIGNKDYGNDDKNDDIIFLCDDIDYSTKLSLSHSHTQSVT